MACGVSIWISKRRSSSSQTATMASTWRTEVTFGSVTRKPGGGVVSVKISNVRNARRRVGASSDLMRMPLNAVGVALRARAAARASRSSTSSSRRP